MTARRCPGCGARRIGRRRYCDQDCERRHRVRVASDRAQTTLRNLDATPLSPTVIAEHSARCPLCTHYIAAGRSRIVAIAPTAPVVVHLDRDGWPEPRRIRSWAHERCAERLQPDDHTIRPEGSPDA